ncbi:helix-turn-helix transcriptional regulator [Hyphococcus luteus]|nr:LuxR C-terminal-related transcriptional regulator [Marinicaulis flavus]
MTLHVSAPVLDITARLIPEIGRREFPGEVLSAYRELAGCDYCAVFDLAGDKGPRVVFAEGIHPRIPDFAVEASSAYAARYWRVDVALQKKGASLSAGDVALLQTTASEIASVDYRRDCYDRPGVIERLALFNLCNGSHLAAGYRARSRGFATPEERRRIAAAGPSLMAAVKRHCELSMTVIADQYTECYRAMVEKAKRRGLSEREAQVAASLAGGEGQAEIAERCGVAFSSVVTYRKRAYMKLKVESKRQLRDFFEMGRAAIPKPGTAVQGH